MKDAFTYTYLSLLMWIPRIRMDIGLCAINSYAWTYVHQQVFQEAQQQ